MGVALSAKKAAALLPKFRKLQMNLSLIICIVTGVLVCASVVFEWKLRLGKVTLGVYWITSLVGAAVCLAVGVLAHVCVRQVEQLFAKRGASLVVAVHGVVPSRPTAVQAVIAVAVDYD